MLDVYESKDIGLFVVFVAKNKAVSLHAVASSVREKTTSQTNVHDILGMPVHDSVSEIEAFEVGYCGGLDLLREPEVST